MNAETQFTSLSVNVVNVDDVGYEGGMPGDHKGPPTPDNWRHGLSPSPDITHLSEPGTKWDRVEHVSMVTEITETLIFDMHSHGV